MILLTVLLVFQSAFAAPVLRRHIQFTDNSNVNGDKNWSEVTTGVQLVPTIEAVADSLNALDVTLKYSCDVKSFASSYTGMHGERSKKRCRA